MISVIVDPKIAKAVISVRLVELNAELEEEQKRTFPNYDRQRVLRAKMNALYDHLEKMT